MWGQRRRLCLCPVGQRLRQRLRLWVAPARLFSLSAYAEIRCRVRSKDTQAHLRALHNSPFSKYICEKAIMIEPIATNVFLLNLVGDVCGSLAAPVGRRRRLRVDSGACGLRGYGATGLRGYEATELRGYGATGLRGY